MATFTQFNIHPYNLATGVHDFSSDTFKIVLTDTLPDVTDELLSDIIEITPGNGYTAGGTATTVSVVQEDDTAKIFCSDVLFTASGGSVGPIRYPVLYNASVLSPLNPLVGFWDRGSSVTLASGDGLLCDFDGTAGSFLVT